MSATDTCRNGHPRTPENTYVWADGRRRCKVCRREWLSNYRNSDFGREYQRSRYHSTDPRTHRIISGVRVRRDLARRKRRAEKRSSQTPSTPLGGVVRREIEQIGDRVWRDIASRTR